MSFIFIESCDKYSNLFILLSSIIKVKSLIMPKSPNVQGKTRKKNTFSQENVSVIFFRYKIQNTDSRCQLLRSCPCSAAIPTAPGSSAVTVIPRTSACNKKCLFPALRILSCPVKPNAYTREPELPSHRYCLLL